MQEEAQADAPKISTMLGLSHAAEEQSTKFHGDDIMRELRTVIESITTSDDMRRVLLRLLFRIEELEHELDSNGIARMNDLKRMQEDIVMKTEMELIDFL
tara:strand:+ start:234 stop:533 length:300 start_codon:yes stop_codon:yes gene_type:complete